MLAAENTLKGRVWGPWATLGFGLVVGIVLLVTQILVAGIFFVVEIATDSTPNFLQIAESLGSVSGLLLALATIASAFVGVGLFFGFVKLRRSFYAACMGHCNRQHRNPNLLRIRGHTG